MTKGLIHVYTGDGKGKTTASMGLAIRAAGQGLKVCIIQFLKGSRGGGEFKLISQRIPEIDFVQSDSSHPMFLKKKPTHAEMEAAAADTFNICREKAASGECDLLILDEINNVIAGGWLDAGEVAEFLANRPEGLEIVLTGREAHPQIQRLADYITEMLKIKHPYDEGYVARRGIEY